jgi:hypothetical protein
MRFGLPWPSAEVAADAEDAGVDVFCTGEFVDLDAYVTSPTWSRRRGEPRGDVDCLRVLPVAVRPRRRHPDAGQEGTWPSLPRARERRGSEPTRPAPSNA